MNDKYRADIFFNWLQKPMPVEDVEVWNKANNIIPEYTELFRDFCLSFYYLMRDTYLGDSHGDSRETIIGMTKEDNEKHFEWCWNKTIDNFKKENIVFKFSKEDYRYFKLFFFEVFYDQNSQEVKDTIEDFFVVLFNRDRAVSKSDLEMFTDVYKILQRSIQF